jgi:hypothetical protein
MDQEKIERSLHELRNHIYIDQALKQKLRNYYSRKKKMKRNAWISGLLAATVFIGLFLGSFQMAEVRASSLNITNAISFFDIGSGEITNYIHVNGELYVSIKDKGIYRYGDKGFLPVNSQEAEFIDFTAKTVFDKENKAVLERDGDIIVQDNKRGKELKIDEGKEPSISPDGMYIAYVKKQGDFENVWIADLDGKTKKQVTTNPIGRLHSDRGLYQYNTPIWHSERNEIFVLKKAEELPQKIMKITLSEKGLSPEEIVERYLQALINRDDDFAKSMMEKAPEFLTYSNPYQIGYEIINSQETQGAYLVEAIVYWTYTANPYYQISTYQFELVEKDNRYIIRKVKEISNKQIVGNERQEVKIIDAGKEEITFSMNEIPKEFIHDNNTRISSLLEEPSGKDIIFTLQEYETSGKHSGVTLMVFNRETRNFSLLARIEGTVGDVVIRHLSSDNTGQYVAAEIFSGVPSPSVYIFDIKEQKQIEKMDQANTFFWQGDQLLIKRVDDTQTFLYQFDPKKKRLNSF